MNKGGIIMAHMTNKKRKQRERNNLKRAFNPMNMGTRDMGFKSNNDRKDYLFRKLADV